VLEYIVLFGFIVVVVLLARVTMQGSRNRRYHSESEKIKYKTQHDAKRVAKEERERARQRAKYEGRPY